MGLINIQYAVAAAAYVIEANPRASRTVPFVSKAIEPLAKLACRLMLGEAARRHRAAHDAQRPRLGQGGGLPFARFAAPTRCSGLEMKSTGEDGDRRRLPDGVRQGAGRGRVTLPTEGTVFITVTDSDKGRRDPARDALSRSRLRDHRHQGHRTGDLADGHPGARDRQDRRGPAARVDFIRNREVDRDQHAYRSGAADGYDSAPRRCATGFPASRR